MPMHDEIEKSAEIHNQLAKQGANFLQIELETSLTFARAALSARADAEKRERDRVNARKGYDTILRFRGRFEPPASSRDWFDERFGQLKSALQELGETDL